MALLQEWESQVPDTTNTQAYHKFWNDFFYKEEQVYKQILANKETSLKGTVEELAAHYSTSVHEMVGFLDGIKESLTEDFEVEPLEKDSQVDIVIDYEKLLFNMHKAKADWLYSMNEWKDIFSEEERKRIKKEYSASGTVRKEEEIGRNDACPCGSGKKYKKCCMKK